MLFICICLLDSFFPENKYERQKEDYAVQDYYHSGFGLQVDYYNLLVYGSD